VGVPQKKFCQQKVHPSVVVEQKQHAPVGQAGGGHGAAPTVMHAWDAAAFALAVDAVSIDPAPSAAAPTPARFSKRPLDTRSSVAAMSLNLLRGSGHVLDHSPRPASIPQTREIHRYACVALLASSANTSPGPFGAIARARTSPSIWPLPDMKWASWRRPTSRSPEFRDSGYLPEAFFPLSVCGLTSLVHTVPGVRVPQGGAHCVV